MSVCRQASSAVRIQDLPSIPVFLSASFLLVPHPSRFVFLVVGWFVRRWFGTQKKFLRFVIIIVVSIVTNMYVVRIQWDDFDVFNNETCSPNLIHYLDFMVVTLFPCFNNKYWETFLVLTKISNSLHFAGHLLILWKLE